MSSPMRHDFALSNLTARCADPFDSASGSVSAGSGERAANRERASPCAEIDPLWLRPRSYREDFREISEARRDVIRTRTRSCEKWVPGLVCIGAESAACGPCPGSARLAPGNGPWAVSE